MSDTPYEYVLIPGRHHLVTNFQATYLHDLLQGREPDMDGGHPTFSKQPTLVWAVTSANHQTTRRNPIPANRREAAIELFGQQEGMHTLVIPVRDVPETEKFAQVTVNTVRAATRERVVLTPENTIVATSTPEMIAMYRALGFQIAPLELDHPGNPPRAWDVLTMMLQDDQHWRIHTHPASQDIFDKYGLGDEVRMVMADPVVGDEGSLTDTRNYSTYAASFESAALRKWNLVRTLVRPGRVVDIGCATGGMLELASQEPRLAESDLYGIEISRDLYEECEHRLSRGDFKNPNTFFYQRNIMSGPIFHEPSVNTTLTFALTHEIFSYISGEQSLTELARAIYEQTAPGGVWINSDVCGPDEPDRIVDLQFKEGDIDTPAIDLSSMSADQAAAYLNGLSPAARFRQFAQDFRANANVEFQFERIDAGTVRLRLADAMEFLLHFSYTENWLSETHEQFCATNWEDWQRTVTDTGFEQTPDSHPWRNEWVVENRLAPTASLTDPDGTPVAWPTTHLLMVAERPEIELG